MSIGVLIFLFVALLTCAASLAVVTVKNLVNAAMWLMVALFGGAVIFVLLQVAYIAVVQVVVYIGAIVILIIFTIMLTRSGDEKQDPGTSKQWPIAAVLSTVLFAGLTYLYLNSPQLSEMAPSLNGELFGVSELGQKLVSSNAYALPFELASVLLLAALIGSIVIAWRK
jgi:NADH-quinone oxidoreductase subunit J